MRLYRRAAILVLSLLLSFLCSAQTRSVSPRDAATSIVLKAPLLKVDSPELFAIDYRDGQVSVVAEKAELGQLLEALGKKIGARIDVAPEVAREPVVARIGPATPTQALAQLLDGPKLEYIVMGSDASGHGLKRVIVRRRNSFGREPLAATKAPGASGR